MAWFNLKQALANLLIRLIELLAEAAIARLDHGSPSS